MVYKNKDGLVWRYGIEEADLTNIAGYRTHGDLRYVEVVLKGSDVPASSAVINDNLVLPKGAQIVKAEWSKANVTVVGGNLSIGLIDADKAAGNAAPTALLNANTPANLNADGTGAGAAIGTVLAKSKKVTWLASAPITAGETTIRIFYRVPKNEVDTLVYVKP